MIKHIENSFPKLKDSIIYYLNEGMATLRVSDNLARVEDHSGFYSKLLPLLDGTLEYDDLVNLMKNENFPENKDIHRILQDMIDYGFLENSNHGNEEILNSYEEQRWSRNIDFFGFYAKYNTNKQDYQKKLINSKVTLLGCGGLGSHILLELAALGIGKVDIVDFDCIELSNLNRQILYRERDIGKSKVLTAKFNIKEFNSKIQINAISKKINSAEDIINIINGSDLVICVADKPRNFIIDWLNTACTNKKIPFINGGLDIKRCVFYSVIPGKSGCVSCWRHTLLSSNPIASEIISIDKDLDKNFATPAPALVPLVAIAAGAMTAEAVRILTSIQPPAMSNQLKEYNFDTGDITTIEKWEKIANCESCAQN